MVRSRSTASGWRPAFGGGTRPRIESLAVLPLENLSVTKGNASNFADSVTDALIAGVVTHQRLEGDLADVGVCPTGPSRSITKIGGELIVDDFIEGSVLHDGRSYGSRVQLIQGATDRHLVRHLASARLAACWHLQNDVARAVARDPGSLTPPGRAGAWGAAGRGGTATATTVS